MSMRRKTRKPRRDLDRQADAPAARQASHRLLELQHGAGNSAVTGLVARSPRTTAPPDLAHLDPEEARDTVEQLRSHRLDQASVRAIQSALGTPGTGSWELADAQALSRFQVDRKLRRGGTYDYVRLNEKTIDTIIREQVAVGMEQEMIHLAVDWERLDTGADTLSVRFDPTLAEKSAVTFEADTVRIVTVGRAALTSARAIAKTVKGQLAPDPLAAMIAPGAVPTILSADDAAAAAGFNASVLSDRRSALIVQRIVGAPRTGELDPVTSQFVARRQQALGLTTQDGTIDDDLFHAFVTSLSATLDMEALIRLVVDYRRLRETGVVDASFDPGLDPAQDYRIVTAGHGAPASIVFGPGGLPAGATAPSLVHTIARAYEEARLGMDGRGKLAREFLAFKLDLLGNGLTDEPFGFFASKAVQALDRFRRLDTAEQSALGGAFDELGRKVEERFSAATAAEQQSYDSIRQDWRSAARP
jgi:hypothetical protein